MLYAKWKYSDKLLMRNILLQLHVKGKAEMTDVFGGPVTDNAAAFEPQSLAKKSNRWHHCWESNKKAVLFLLEDLCKFYLHLSEELILGRVCHHEKKKKNTNHHFSYGQAAQRCTLKQPALQRERRRRNIKLTGSRLWNNSINSAALGPGSCIQQGVLWP